MPVKVEDEVNNENNTKKLRVVGVKKFLDKNQALFDNGRKLIEKLLIVRGEEMIASNLEQIFTQVPDVIYGYTDISYSSLSGEYKSALVFAVPHEEQLDLSSYTEERFENSILTARKRVESILKNFEGVLNEGHIKYYIPPMAQQNEEELLAVFSFKYAAVNAGLGWIGKNDVLVTKKYGPRVRLAVVLIDYTFEYGEKITESKCGLCMVVCPYGME